MHASAPGERVSGRTGLLSRLAGGAWPGRFDAGRDLVAHGFELLARRAGPAANAAFVIVMEADTLTVVRTDNGRSHIVSTHAADAIAAMVESLAAARAAAGLQSAIALAFADTIALDLEQTLPARSRRMLDAMAGSVAAAEAPFGEDGTLALWTFAPGPTDTVVAHITLLPADRITPVLSACSARGMLPAYALRCNAEDIGSAKPAQPSWLGTAVPRGGWSLAAVPHELHMLALAAIIVGGAAGAQLAYNHAQLLLEASDIASARGTMRAAARSASDAQRIEADRAVALGLIRTLDLLAERLPEDAYLEHLEFDGTTIKLTGLANSAADTLALVSRTAGLSGGELLAAVSRDAEGKLERFKLGAKFSATATGAAAASLVSQP